MSKIKEGDLITVTQELESQFRAVGDITAIRINEEQLPPDLGNVRNLRGKEIYTIEHNDADDDLKKYGVNIGHFTLRGEPIISVSLDDPDFILINGEVKIYDEPKGEVAPMEKRFFDQGEAQAVATALNRVERDRFKHLKSLVDQAVNMMETIVEKGRV